MLHQIYVIQLDLSYIKKKAGSPSFNIRETARGYAQMNTKKKISEQSVPIDMDSFRASYDLSKYMSHITPNLVGT